MDDLESITRGTVDLVSKEELAQKLSSGRPLRVKLGVDPTSPDLHIGHTVALGKLRTFQDLGHTVVLIIGDFTTRVGDPSGRDSTRPTLTREEIEENAKTYKDQAFKVLDKDKTEVVSNSEWLDPFVSRPEGLLKTMARHTVQQLLAREDFQTRMKANSPITLLEILYPILQGYDSVAVKADVELGGTDQLFNLLMGRTMQKDAGQAPQVVLTLPLLVGLDGKKKMSKSYGNHIGISEGAREIFGKVMKISDEQMSDWYELLTSENLKDIKKKHPMEAKKALAELLTARFQGEAAGKAERIFFEETFSKKKLPEDIALIVVEEDKQMVLISKFLADIDAAKSRKEAARLIRQGAVKLDAKKVREDLTLKETAKKLRGDGSEPLILQVGKHKFFKLIFK